MTNTDGRANVPRNLLTKIRLQVLQLKRTGVTYTLRATPIVFIGNDIRGKLGLEPLKALCWRTIDQLVLRNDHLVTGTVVTKDQSTLSTMVLVYFVIKSCSAFGTLCDGRIVSPNSFAKTHSGKCITGSHGQGEKS